MGNDAYQEIKDKYKLLDYIIAKGFNVDKKKSSATWLVLKKDSEKLLYHTKKEFYKNVDIHGDTGDIINFVANRVNGLITPTENKSDIYQAIETLKGFDFNTNKDFIKTQKKVVDKKQLLSKIAKTDFSHAPLTDYSYLVQERHISKTTIDSDLFKGRIYNSYFRIESNGHVITNFAFGKYINDKLEGLEVRNKGLNHVAGLHEAIFHTNYKNFDSIDYVLIAESAIDALSHYELFNGIDAFKDKNLLYISTGGNIYDEKINKIFSLIDRLNFNDTTAFCSITDNDIKGFYYDHLLLAAFVKHYTGANLIFKDNEHFYIYEFTDLGQDRFERLNDSINLANAQIKNENALPGYGDYFVIKKENKTVTLFVPLKTPLNNSTIQNIVKEMGFGHRIISHKPKEVSDWNDRLKEIKALKQNETIKKKTIE